MPITTDTVTLTQSEIDDLLERVRFLAQEEFKAGWTSLEGKRMRDLDFHVTRAQTAYSDIQIMLGREPGPPLEF